MILGLKQSENSLLSPKQKDGVYSKFTSSLPIHSKSIFLLLKMTEF